VQNGDPPLRRAGPPAGYRLGRHRQPEEPSAYRDVFAIREFRGLWAAHALWAIGDPFTQVAVAILVYGTTRSVFLTALAYALTYLPPMAGSPVLSWLTGSFPPQGVLIAVNMIRAALLALIALPAMPFAGLCAALVATALLGPPFTRARSALLHDALPGEKLLAAAVIGRSTGQLGQLAGLAAGAGLVAAFGPQRALTLDALSFCLSALVVACCVRPRPAPPRRLAARPVTWSATLETAARIFGSPVPRILVLFGCLAGFTVVPEGLAAPYARALGGGPITVGLLMGAMPAGTVAGAFVIGGLARPSDRMRPMGWLAMLSCAPLVLSLSRPPLCLILPLWLLAGLGSAYQLAAAAAFARALPAACRAHAFSVAQSGLLAAQCLGILAGGAAAQRMGPQAVVALAGLLGLIAAAALATGWTQRHSELVP